MLLFNPIRLDAHNPGPMTGSGNHTYLLVADHGPATLIDAGVADARHLDAIAERLHERDAQLGDILVTHGHPDHASGATALAQAHPGARFFKYPWLEVDARYAVEWQPIRDGDRFQAANESLVALHTPGHSPDHVAFWHEPTRTMFTGDLVVSGSSVMIHASRGGDLAQYLSSLERLLELAPARLLPAHGPEVVDPEPLLRGYIEHRRMRERQVLDALAAGRDSVLSIVESIYDGLASALVPAARENVCAHLEKLRREGRAEERDGLWKSL
jgi:glyoxylase-like metal-dependent hydrolase (beta-lactamase superfamily II)